MSGIKPLLIELGCEELPANQVTQLVNRLAEGICSHLENQQLIDGDVSAEVFATPRRLAVLIQKVASAQPDQVIERKGPSVDAAFDSDGQPTKAAQGFAQSVGQSVDTLERLKTDQGEWLAATVHQPGQTLEAVLQVALTQVIKDLASAKSMRWHAGDERFVRPVRWCVLLHGSDILKGELFGLPASNLTWGHRIHAPGPHVINEATEYTSILEKAFVLAKIEDRHERIKTQVEALASKRHWLVDAQTRNSLIDENANLTEWPIALLGSFDENFLKVPEPALVSAMQLHQKCFPLRDEKTEALKPHFIAIANIESEDVDAMRAGFERVIRPRLADAEFFFDQDCATPLADRVNGLNDMLFQKDLGTVADKASRLKDAAPWFAEQLDLESETLERAIALAKCDLLTEMVGEFPELQGVMGRYYADVSSEPAEVAMAIEQHYWPKNAGDCLPTTPLAAAVAMADRADTLIGVFGVGLKPKGSKDPFALRRAAQGLIRILEHYPALSLRAVLEQAATHLAQRLSWKEGDRERVVEDVMAFCLDRARSYAHDHGVSNQTINAVFAVPMTTITDLMARARAVEGLLAHASIEQLIAANKRLANLLSKVEADLPDTVDTNLLEEKEERSLYEAWEVQQAEVSIMVEQGNYDDALAQLAQLAAPLDAYFEQVMVMVDDEATRLNRLCLLNQMRQRFLRIADLAQLGR